MALVDRCPHRGVTLSLGKVRDGIIECAFHGWRFDGAGRNQHVPWNSDAKRETLCARALPVRELGGLIWLYTGFNPAAEPVVSETLKRPNIILTAQHMIWKAHWTRFMENMLDTPHLPFVHRKTIGKGLRNQLGHDMDMVWEPTTSGGLIHGEIGGKRRGAGLVYLFPNVIELIIDPPGKTFRLIAVCTPYGDSTTRLSIYTVRNFARLSLLNPIFWRLNLRIALEDKAIIESCQPFEVPHAGFEKSVRTDRPTFAFRKIYFERLKGTKV